MNKYTKKEMFKSDVQTILNESTLINIEDCVIHNDVLYEKLGALSIDDTGHRYRFFLDVDDYDYLENESLADILDTL